MLQLTYEGIQDSAAWESRKIHLPKYDVNLMRENTRKNPVWLHFGAGNIFRGFIAGLQQTLLEKGLTQSGILVADTFDYDLIDKIYEPFDSLALSVGLKADGDTVMSVTASIAEAMKADYKNDVSMRRLKEVFCNPSLQMVSFTITEKGYALRDLSGELLPMVCSDYELGPDKATHAMSIVTALTYRRYCNGAYPLALCSMDNCSHNGEKLQTAMYEVAENWASKGWIERGFLDYLKDPKKITFPWSMIDKITPRPAKEIQEMLASLGIAQMEPVITNRNTYIAPFVNAEIPQYLVIEDDFPNGRPALEQAGVYMTDRDTVNKTERMKVTTCLNPLHTAMAVTGCLLGYQHIAKEMQDEDIRNLVERIGYQEGLPVVVNPGIIQPEAFIKEVLEERLVNPFIPDMPQRIATDTSMKIPIRFGETMKAYEQSSERRITDLVGIPLAIAAWFRYLLGVDDDGKEMEISSDPMLLQLQDILSGIEYSHPESYDGQLRKIMSNQEIFVVDLCEVGLSDKIESIFIEMLVGKGAVRATLHKYLHK